MGLGYSKLHNQINLRLLLATSGEILVPVNLAVILPLHQLWPTLLLCISKCLISCPVCPDSDNLVPLTTLAYMGQLHRIPKL